MPNKAITRETVQYILSSAKGTHFTGGINQNATEEENLAGLASNSIIIRTVIMQADQALDWNLLIFGKDTFADTDLDADAFIAQREMDMASYGKRIAGAGQYYMELDNLAIPYVDADGTYELHLALQNLSATAKNAGATGEVVISIVYEVIQDLVGLSASTGGAGPMD